MSDFKLVSTENFDSEVSGETVIVDFYAEWCGPCKMQETILKKLHAETSVKVIKVDIEDNPQLSSQFNIRNLPTLIIFKEGQKKQTFVGLTKENELKEHI